MYNEKCFSLIFAFNSFGTVTCSLRRAIQEWVEEESCFFSLWNCISLFKLLCVKFLLKRMMEKESQLGRCSIQINGTNRRLKIGMTHSVSRRGLCYSRCLSTLQDSLRRSRRLHNTRMCYTSVLYSVWMLSTCSSFYSRKHNRKIPPDDHTWEFSEKTRASWQEKDNKSCLSSLRALDSLDVRAVFLLSCHFEQKSSINFQVHFQERQRRTRRRNGG